MIFTTVAVAVFAYYKRSMSLSGRRLLVLGLSGFNAMLCVFYAGRLISLAQSGEAFILYVAAAFDVAIAFLLVIDGALADLYSIHMNSKRVMSSLNTFTDSEEATCATSALQKPLPGHVYQPRFSLSSSEQCIRSGIGAPANGGGEVVQQGNDAVGLEELPKYERRSPALHATIVDMTNSESEDTTVEASEYSPSLGEAGSLSLLVSPAPTYDLTAHGASSADSGSSMLPSSPFQIAAHKIQLSVSILTGCSFVLLLVSFGFNSQASILVQLLRFPQAFINVGIIAFASLKSPLSSPRASTASSSASASARASSSHRGQSRSRRRRHIVLACCSAGLILVLILLAGFILPSAAETGSPLFLILGALNILVASLLCADVVLMDIHRRRENKSAPAGTSSSGTSSSSSSSTSSSVSNTDQPQSPQIHVYQPRLSLTSDRVGTTTLSVLPHDDSGAGADGDTELEPLPKYQQQQPQHQAPTIIIDLANLEPGQHPPHRHFSAGSTSSVGPGDTHSSSSSSRGSTRTPSRSPSRGQGSLMTLGSAESNSRRTSWHDLEAGIVPDYSQAIASAAPAAAPAAAAAVGEQVSAERSASGLLPSTTATSSLSTDVTAAEDAAAAVVVDIPPGSITAFTPAPIPTSAPPVYTP
ncbi:unnamed protein product [Mortierella alpina]